MVYHTLFMATLMTLEFDVRFLTALNPIGVIGSHVAPDCFMFVPYLPTCAIAGAALVGVPTHCPDTVVSTL